MNKRNNLWIAALVVALLLAAGCSTVQQGAVATAPAGDEPAAATEGGLLGQIKERGSIVVGTSADYPPYESIDAEGNFVGFDMDLIRAVGAKLGVEVEIQDMPFDSLIASVQEGKLDAVIAAMQATPDRDAQVDFTVPYRMTKDAFLAKGDSEIALSTPEDAAGYSIGAQTGTVQEKWVQEKLVGEGLTPADKVFSYERADQGALDVANGRIDLLLIDAEPAQSIAETSGLKVLLVTESTAFSGKSIAVPEGATDLKAELDRIIEELLADGTIQQIQEENGLP